MGVPKQKWTPEEEEALKAGIRKHGVGRWSLIQKDPEFNRVLKYRTNVHLKDKYRNICIMASSGAGSRSKPSSSNRTAKRNRSGSLRGEDHGSSDDEMEYDSASDDQIIDSIDDEAIEKDNSSTIIRIDDLILEAVAKLKEPRGSSLQTIAQYVEHNYSASPNHVAMNLKLLTEEKLLIKVRDLYRLAPDQAALYDTKADVDAMLLKMKSMSPQEAADAAAKAVAEAQAAIAEAEAAAKEADEAEAEAESAHLFAESCYKSSTRRRSNR